MSIRSSTNTIRIHITVDQRVFRAAQKLKVIFGCETNSELVGHLIAQEAMEQAIKIGTHPKERHERK